MFTLIETLDDLGFLNSELLKKPCVAVDTEFRRTSKTNMKLALIQINDSEEIYLIDCIKIGKPDSNCSFLFSQNVKKIIHSHREDMEAIFSWTKLNLVNYFDTQLANAFLGGAYSVSYQQLVEEKFGVRVDKKETRTNWLKRPLTDSQLHYAATDVQYLLNLHTEQTHELKRTEKIPWFEEELKSLSNKLLTPPKTNHYSSTKITKAVEKKFLNDFNEIVLNISEREKINHTLFFSRKYQKEFLKMILDTSIEEAFKQVTLWRKKLIYKPLIRLVEDLKF